MKPVTINITNLVGSITVISDKENATVQIQKNVSDALLNVLKKNNGIHAVVVKDYDLAKHLLRDLIETASRAIIAIDDNKPSYEICDIAVEEIEKLTSQISSCILGNGTMFMNSNTSIV